jgi:hypothetical protein
MEEERARALLRAERQRLERLLASVDADHDRVAPADEVAEAVERAADGEDHAVRGPDLVDAARLGPSREPFQVLLDPAVQDNPLAEDDEATFDESPPEHDPAMPDVPGDVAEDDTGRIRPLPERGG